MLCKKLNHAAFRCADAKETVDFYTEVLGLRFAHAVGGDHVPSTGEYDPHFHIFLHMEDGSSLAFFEVPGCPGPMKDTEMHDWIQHFAFEVDTLETLNEAKAKMEARGMPVLGPTDHGFITSIYFHDPSGHRLELTTPTGPIGDADEAEARARELLDLWDKDKDWSGLEAAGLHG